MTPSDMLKGYCARHNIGVRTRDFSDLVDLFKEDAVLRFERIVVGPFFDYLMKPVRIADLSRTLARWFPGVAR